MASLRPLAWRRSDMATDLEPPSTGHTQIAPGRRMTDVAGA